MKTAKLILMFILISAATGFGSTVAYWNFDNGVPGELLYNTGGAEDLSGNGYTMYGYDTANSPYFEDGNTPSGYGMSIRLDGGQDGYTTDPNLNEWSPTEWTIEISAKLDTVTGWLTMIGRDGSSQGELESDFYLQKNDEDGAFRVNFDTAGGDRYIFDSNVTAEANQWYHIAVTSDGNTVDMYLNEFDGTGFHIVSSNDISDANDPALADADGAVWTFGRGWYDGGAVDNITGNLDNIRFTDQALSPEDFLIGPLTCISPADGKEPTDTAVTLQWDFYEPNATAYSYDVYFSSNLSEVDPDTATTPHYTTSTKSQEVTGLDNSTTYYWRVDPVMNEGDTPRTGKVWSFTTVGPEAVILTNPESKTAEAGSTVEFTVDALSDESYAWYKEGDSTVLSTTDTLTVSNVDIDDEGYYYCEVSGGGSTAVSESAGLWTERLAGYWKLDGDLTDSVAEEVSGAPVHNAVSADANTAAGDGVLEFADQNAVAGQALELSFDEDGEFAQVINDPEFFNFFPQGFTASCWVNTTETVWSPVFSKFYDGTSGWGLGAGDWGAWLDPFGAAYADANTGQWNMMTATYDPEAGEYTLYMNGVRQFDDAAQPTTVLSGINPVNLVANPAPLRMGCDSGEVDGAGLTGQIDEVRLYTYPLDSVEVAQLYQQHVPGSQCVEPVEYDYNGDCVVNFYDFATVFEDWFECNIYPDCIQ